MATDKHTIYIDVDDEITAIIDKVKTAPGKIVALVLPKRATVLQSIVNMKLLKKSATAAKKSLVLITSEAGLLPLAGAVGLHVAKSLQSKPEIPSGPDEEDAVDPEISEALHDDEPELDKTKSIGALAGLTHKGDDETETIELDDLSEETPAVAKSAKKGKKFSKGFKVPNFDRFRLGLFLAALGVILLIGGWIFAAVVLPKATVTIKTDTSTNTSSITFTANTALKDLDVNQGLVPASQEEIKKTDTEKATPSGKKDTGTKATGTMTLTNCIKDDSTHTIPAGTTFSSGSLVFATNDAVTLAVSTFQGSTCKSANVGDSQEVGVTAVNAGANYNVDARSYTSSISGIVAEGSAMAGGTSNIVTVLSQSDVDAAVAAMKGRLDNDAKTALKQQLQSKSLKGLDETLVVGNPAVKVEPAVGTETTEEATVTAETTYTILGVRADYLSQLIKKDVSAKVDTAKQSILDDGLNSAVIRLDSRKSATEVQMTLQTLVIAGPQLDATAIKNEIKGKKKGEVERIIMAKKGVTDVTISYSPFWVYSTPKSANKITVTIEKPEVKATTPSETSNDSNP
jgi:hypothetical protein